MTTAELLYTLKEAGLRPPLHRGKALMVGKLTPCDLIEHDKGDIYRFPVYSNEQVTLELLKASKMSYDMNSRWMICVKDRTNAAYLN